MPTELFEDPVPKASLSVSSVEIRPITGWRGIKLVCLVCDTRKASRWVNGTLECRVFGVDFTSGFCWHVCIKCSEDIAARMPEGTVKRGR